MPASYPSKSSRLLVSLIVVGLGTMFVATAQITYVDADDATNTTVPAGWTKRSPFANGGDVWQNATSTDDAAMITVVSGLTPGESYDISVYYWSDADNWRVSASLDGTNFTTYSSIAASGSEELGTKLTTAIAHSGSSATGWTSDVPGHFTTNVLVAEGNRRLYQAWIGRAVADTNGHVTAYIEDTGTVDDFSRVWYDGLGYELSYSEVDDFSVDFTAANVNGQQGLFSEAGYFSFIADHETDSSNGTDPRLIVDRTEQFRVANLGGVEVGVTVSYSAPAEAPPAVKQMIGRSDANTNYYTGDMADLMRDWIGMDSRAASGGNGTAADTMMTFTLTGIPAGTYQYRGYHHDVADVRGVFGLAISDATRSSSSLGDFRMSSSREGDSNPSNMPGGSNDPVALSSTIEFIFTSDGVSSVVVAYSVRQNADRSRSYMGVNGFEISPAVDSDGDFIPDALDLHPGVDDATLDDDGDTLSNVAEYYLGTNAQQADTDGDGLSDAVETGSGLFVSGSDTGTSAFLADSDGDGALDAWELNVGTNPFYSGSVPADEDNDGMDDTWELQHGLDITSDDSLADRDQDRLTNLAEFLGADGVVGGFDQTNPELADTDADTFSDYVEIMMSSAANDAEMTPSGILAQTEFNLLPWLNERDGAEIATASPILAGSHGYGAVDTSAGNNGVMLSFPNLNVSVDCLVDFRIDGTLDQEINIVTANIQNIQTSSAMHCLMRIKADGSIHYFNGDDYLQDSPAGTIVAGHTYSVKYRYDIPNNSYQIELIDRSNGDQTVMAVSGLDLATRNAAPANKLYFGIGLQNASASGFDLSVDNMLVTRAPTLTGTSRAIIDSDGDGGSDIWEIEYLNSLDYLGRVEDSDGDIMDQAWEIANFGDESQGALDNPDGDLAPNWEEYLYGTDPNVVDSNVGYWSVERWYEMPYYTVPELVGNVGFYDSPWHTEALTKSGVSMGRIYAGSRMRGYVQVEQDGEYYFWLSCRTSGDLMLSTDETPYRKQRIAYIGADAGTGHGIRYDSGNLWDVYASQMSAPVQLIAGQKYYLEVIHQNGHGGSTHIHVAWAKTGGERTLIARANMSSFPGQDGDVDDDSLPDVWELQYGLDPTDNGIGNLAVQGERGDLDSDGLNNRMEFLLGTNPALIDTDGDGLSDRDEYLTYGTDPTVSDATAEALVADISPSLVAELGTTWTETADGVLSSSFRGQGTWDFSVPAAGYWVVQIQAKLRGNLRSEETVPVQVSIDGQGIMRPKMTFLNGQPGSLRVLTPYLSAGLHQLGLFIDNYTARRSMEITAIKVLQPGGLDIDGNGRSDAVESQLAKLNYVAPHTVVESHISPVFIEGMARSLEHFELRSQHQGPDSTIRHRDSYWANKIPVIQNNFNQVMAGFLLTPGTDHTATGEIITSLEGPGYGRWYVGLDLNANQAAGYSAFFENGALGSTGVVVWRPLNLFDATEIDIPVGSSLLMGAWQTESDNSRLTFTIAGTEQEIGAENTLTWLFDTAGDHTITVIHESSGETCTLTVHVREATLPAGLSVVENRYNWVGLPGVAPDQTLDSGREIGFSALQALASGGSEIELTGGFPGNHRTAVRMAENGAILDQQEIIVIGISDALRNASNIVTPIGEGMLRVRSPLLVTNLPAGATVRISIFAGGVTFADGTTVKILSAADFDENGVYILEMIIPEDRLGAPCHHIDIFDADGQKING